MEAFFYKIILLNIYNYISPLEQSSRFRVSGNTFEHFVRIHDSKKEYFREQSLYHFYHYSFNHFYL